MGVTEVHLWIREVEITLAPRTMNQLSWKHPQRAPWAAALIVAVISVLFAAFGDRSLKSELIEGLLVAIAVFFVVRSLQRGGGS